MKVLNFFINRVWPVICMIMLVYASDVTASHIDVAHLLWVFVWAANCAIYVPVIKTKKS